MGGQVVNQVIEENLTGDLPLEGDDESSSGILSNSSDESLVVDQGLDPSELAALKEDERRSRPPQEPIVVEDVDSDDEE